MTPQSVVFVTGLLLVYIIGCLGTATTTEDGKTLLIGRYEQPQDVFCSKAVEGLHTIVWKKEEATIDFVKEKKHFENIPENSTLRILHVAPAHSGNFSCWNETGNLVLEEFQIQVFPFVQKYDKHKNVIEDDPLQIVCNAWGVPAPTIVWTHSNNSLEASSRVTYKTVAAAPFPAIENGTLRIEPAEFKDVGNYTCTATNVHGHAAETLVVNVKDKYAALWPFLGICAEVAILCTIILIYEKRRSKRLEAEERQEEAAHLNADNDAKVAVPSDDVRQRK